MVFSDEGWHTRWPRLPAAVAVAVAFRVSQTILLNEKHSGCLSSIEFSVWHWVAVFVCVCVGCRIADARNILHVSEYAICIVHVAEIRPPFDPSIYLIYQSIIHDTISKNVKRKWIQICQGKGERTTKTQNNNNNNRWWQRLRRRPKCHAISFAKLYGNGLNPWTMGKMISHFPKRCQIDRRTSGWWWGRQSK